jgi:hypothetical protein
MGISKSEIIFVIFATPEDDKPLELLLYNQAGDV